MKEDLEQKVIKAKLIEDSNERNLQIFNLRKKYLIEYDSVLNKIQSGPHFLKDPQIVQIVDREIKRHDGKLYNLIAYCVMSNHVHLVIDTGVQLEYIETEEELFTKYKTLDKILKQIKGASSRNINSFLKRTGQFWDRESYDIYIRSDIMLTNVINYTLQNPVKVGIVRNWEDFEGNYYVGVDNA